jgi:hypothetical protein
LGNNTTTPFADDIGETLRGRTLSSAAAAKTTAPRKQIPRRRLSRRRREHYFRAVKVLAQPHFSFSPFVTSLESKRDRGVGKTRGEKSKKYTNTHISS